jgi:hypothetical protein
VNNAKDIGRFTRDSKYIAIVAINQVSIASTEYFVFGNERAAFGKTLQSFNLFFETANELFCFFEAIVRDKGPCFFDITLCCTSDPNAKFCGHV